MKKLIFAIIFVIWFLSTQISFADCNYNYWYNWRYVTYCYWDNRDSSIWDSNYYDLYYSNNNWNVRTYYNNNYSDVYNDNYYNWYYYNKYNNNSYYNSQNDLRDNRTNDENFLNTIYRNNLQWEYIKPEKQPKNDDFFTKNVIWNDIEMNKIDKINIKYFKLNNATNKQKYTDAKRFFDALKEEIRKRYNEWKITYNNFNDIINEMDNLVFNLNEQFTNLQKYEQTSKVFYYDLSLDNSKNIKQNYEKLKYVLKN